MNEIPWINTNYELPKDRSHVLIITPKYSYPVIAEFSRGYDDYWEFHYAIVDHKGGMHIPTGTSLHEITSNDFSKGEGLYWASLPKKPRVEEYVSIQDYAKSLKKNKKNNKGE